MSELTLMLELQEARDMATKFARMYSDILLAIGYTPTQVENGEVNHKYVIEYIKDMHNFLNYERKDNND